MKPTSILGRYLTKQIVFNFLAVLLIILGIIFLFEMVERLRRISGHPELGIWFAVQLAVARLPKTAEQVFPFVMMIIFIFYFSDVYALGDPQLISKINSAFEKIESWLLKIATPAAAVAVGTGVFMKKFSFGDDERIRTGKKLIKGSLFSYAFILAIDLILSAIKSLVG